MNETELRSKSDQEINELAAIVMGWSVAKHQNGRMEAQSYPAIFHATKGSFIVRSKFGMDEEWQPISDANQAINLAEHVANLSNHGYLSTGRARKIWSVVFAGYLVEDEVFAKALTLASLLANDSLKGEVGE